MSTPGWIECLRRECERSSQTDVARRINYSQTVVNQILNGSYKGNVARVQAAVEGAFMGKVVQCPVIGEIPRDVCIQHQGRHYAATSEFRVRLYHACKTCPNRQPNKGEK